MNKAILITPVIAILLGAIPSAMAETNSLHYNVGYNDGWYQAQTDWNTLQYSIESGGYNVCPDGHSKSYCNGYHDGYSNLWLNFVNSPSQSQSNDVNTNIKGNDNMVTNIINQGQASNSPNTASSGYGGNR